MFSSNKWNCTCQIKCIQVLQTRSSFIKSFHTNILIWIALLYHGLSAKHGNVFFYILKVHVIHLSRPAWKPILWILRKVSTRIRLSMPHRLNRIDTFRLLWIFCFRNYYSIPLSAWDEMCRPGSVCANWSGSIHYAEAIMLNLTRDGSFTLASLFTMLANDLFIELSFQVSVISQRPKVWFPTFSNLYYIHRSSQETGYLPIWTIARWWRTKDACHTDSCPHCVPHPKMASCNGRSRLFITYFVIKCYCHSRHILRRV